MSARREIPDALPQVGTALAVGESQTQTSTPHGPPTLETIAELPEILTRAQAAWLLQVSGQHLQDSARRGDVPSTLLGSTRRFSKSALLRAVRGETET